MHQIGATLDSGCPCVSTYAQSIFYLPMFSTHGGSGVNQAQDVTLMSIKVPADVKKLEEWAAFNVSSMTAELFRSARERAEREQCEKAAG